VDISIRARQKRQNLFPSCVSDVRSFPYTVTNFIKGHTRNVAEISVPDSRHADFVVRGASTLRVVGTSDKTAWR
jgi:hypothetical protein